MFKVTKGNGDFWCLSISRMFNFCAYTMQYCVAVVLISLYDRGPVSAGE
jgi:hypothetical protein